MSEMQQNNRSVLLTLSFSCILITETPAFFYVSALILTISYTHTHTRTHTHAHTHTHTYTHTHTHTHTHFDGVNV